MENGKDITGPYIGEKLEELKAFADSVIVRAEAAYRRRPENKHQIFLEHFRELNGRLAPGAIGPASAAAMPLLQDKQEELAAKLEYDLTGFLFGGFDPEG